MDAVGGAGWSNDVVPASSGAFTIEFTAYPKADAGAYPPTVGAIVGLSDGPAAAASDVGPAVRFTPNGDIEARNGETYAATTRVQYRSNYPYRFRVTVDLASRTYSVAVKERTEQGTPLTTLAEGYAFPPEAGVTRIDNVARLVDSAAGALALCSVVASP
jgi:hypothetical protein